MFSYWWLLVIDFMSISGEHVRTCKNTLLPLIFSHHVLRCVIFYVSLSLKSLVLSEKATFVKTNWVSSLLEYLLGKQDIKYIETSSVAYRSRVLLDRATYQLSKCVADVAPEIREELPGFVIHHPKYNAVMVVCKIWLTLMFVLTWSGFSPKYTFLQLIVRKWKKQWCLSWIYPKIKFLFLFLSVQKFASYLTVLNLLMQSSYFYSHTNATFLSLHGDLVFAKQNGFK